MSTKNRTVGILTLGCKVNQYESEAIAEVLQQKGYDTVEADAEKSCDAYVINTCTVTSEADRKGRQMIRRLLSVNPNAFILVTGCQAQNNAKAIAAIPGVDYICGNTQKMQIVDAIDALFALGQKNERPDIHVGAFEKLPFEPMIIKRSERTRAYVKIEDGCENKCSYCAIPGARGPIRSKMPQDVVHEVSALVAAGYREIVLTGIETGSWGKDIGGLRLCDLLCRLDTIPGLERMRLGSLDPSSVTEEFAQTVAGLHTLTPHFHLSLQSGSDKVLASMKRKYNREMAFRAFQRLTDKIPGVLFTTDVIVGFPGETEADFEETKDFVTKIGFLMVHVFPYSKRAGTVAAELPNQVPQEEKHRRVSALSALAAEARKRIFESRIGQTTEVLFESKTPIGFSGHTDSFIEVQVPAENTDLHNQCRIVRITDFTKDYLIGELCDNEPKSAAIRTE